jgi:hypothetical protein
VGVGCATPELLERKLDVRHRLYLSTVTNHSLGVLRPRVVAEHVPTPAVYSEVFACGEKLVALTIVEM